MIQILRTLTSSRHCVIYWSLICELFDINNNVRFYYKIIMCLVSVDLKQPYRTLNISTTF